ncbi:MAG: hypothetical protein QMC13_10665, partial [Colwellia sp.]
MTYKRASFYCLSGVTGILCLVTILFSTPWGAQLSLFTLSGLTPVKVEYKSGSLLHDLTLNKLTIKNDKMVSKANDIKLKLHLRCLWKKQLCIDEINIESLQINLKNLEDIRPEALVEKGINSSNFTLPFNIDLKKLVLANAQIKSKGLVVKLSDFSSALSINNTSINNIAITIESSSLAYAHIILSDTQTISPKPIETVWPLASLPELYSPFKITLETLAIKKISVDKIDAVSHEINQITIDDTVARLSWFKTELFIDELASKIA